MREVDWADLKTILEAHKRYLERRAQGQRALLKDTNLTMVNLGRALLDEVDFSGALLIGEDIDEIIRFFDLLFAETG